jgi:hypothetical protein
MAAEAKRIAAEARKAAKDARNAAAREKEEHIRAVRAAANAEGLTAFIGERIPASKTVDEIIATLRARKTKANKNAAKVAKGPTRKAASIVRSLLRQVRESRPSLTQNEIGKITSKMNVGAIIAAANKRRTAKQKKNNRERTHGTLKQFLLNAGIAEANITKTNLGKKNTQNAILAAIQKRLQAKKRKLNKSGQRRALEQLARTAGISPRHIKPKKNETTSATMRAAVKRRNVTLKKERQVVVKQAILEGIEGSDITVEDIKSAFCTRAK